MNSFGTRGSRAKVESQPSEILVLSRISAALSGLWDLDAILGVGLDSTLDIMNGTIGEILLIDENTGELSHFVHRGLSMEFVENVRLSLGEGITGSVAQSGKAVLLEDISSDPRVAHRELVMAEGLKAYICVLSGLETRFWVF
jgi:signal transduction protein with GAF and PtsI domain